MRPFESTRRASGHGPLLALVALLGGVWWGSLAAGAEDAAAGWQRALRDIGSQLLAEEWAAAEAACETLAAELTDTIVGGTGADVLLAMTATYRAIALSGLGRGDEAVWDWQVAQQLFPDVRQLDLAAFGPAGSYLGLHPPRRPAVERPDGPPRRGAVEPLVEVAAPAPECPAGQAFHGLSVDVVVQVVVGEDGRPREPLILSSSGEHTLVWATLEALRSWRFEPARRDGRPEAALYKLTASYVVPSG